jgi:type I restriction enzyme S subunit
MGQIVVVSMGELISRGVLDMSDGYRTKRTELGSPGFRIIRVADVANGEIRLESPDFVSSKFEKSVGKKIGKAGDILLTTKGTVGRVAVMPLVNEPVVYSPQICFFRVLNHEAINSSFLKFWFSSPEFLAQASDRMNNTDMAAYINLADIRSLKLSLPSTSSQKAIAEVLGALDDKIAANTKLAETAGRMATTLFDLAASSPTSDRPLAEVVSTQYGLTTSAHLEPGPKFLRVTDINKQPWITWSTTPNCTVSGSDLVKYRVQEGDILVARMADPGKAAYVDSGDPEAVFASYLVRLKALDPSQSLYIYYFLRSATYQAYAEGAMQGSVQMNMNAKVIVGTAIKLPLASTILAFNEKVGPLRQLIQTTLKENFNLAKTRDTLLPQLMSGKLRVRDVEKVAEGTL